MVMGSIEENKYRYFGKSIDNPSENPHHEFHIHKLTYFHVFQLLTSNFLGFLDICPVSGRFQLFHFRFFFLGGGAFLVTIPVTILSIDI